MKRNGKKKWIPIGDEKVVETARWKYVLGVYDHFEYGKRCFRISKFIRDNDYFIGHFVVVPQDQSKVLPVIAELIRSLDIEKNERSDETEFIDSSKVSLTQPIRMPQAEVRQLTFNEFPNDMSEDYSFAKGKDDTL